MMKKLFLTILAATLLNVASAQLQINFYSKDGLKITADWYPVSIDEPIILLCHQAGSSRGEFSETALKLNKFGFNCLAIDLRAGDQSNGVINETAKEATAQKKSSTTLDAQQDIVAGIDYLYDKFKKPVILLGSSYSASLSLIIAIDNYKVSGVAAFSPGEYFSDSTYIRKNIRTLLKPLFTTSSLKEAETVTDLVKDVNSRIKVQYIPSSKGEHGAKALWKENPYNQEYWIALMSFLDKMKKTEYH
jgi:dienelactone hydrolase